MKAKALLALTFMASTVCTDLVTRADSVLFVVGPPSIQNTNAPREAWVLPLEKQEDIDWARELIRLGGRTNNYLVSIVAVAGADGTNRNHLIQGAPEWSWHVGEFRGFASGSFAVCPCTPSEIEQEFVNCSCPNVPWTTGTVMAELDPAVSFNVAMLEVGTVSLQWSNLGSYYAYTVEYCDRLTGDSWQPVPGITWPIRQTNWSMSTGSYRSSTMFFRVRAELVGP